MPLPKLTVVSGPPGSGKTTLAHRIARELGCPAVIRDEIKQGMVAATPGYEPGTDDPLNLATLKAFFDVVTVLARAGVALVAEAAYQDRLWRPNLEPILELAQIRVIRCTTDATTAGDRIAHRAAHSTHRAAHADRALLRAINAGEHRLDTFGWIRMELPTLSVDTTGGYEPALRDIVTFASR